MQKDRKSRKTPTQGNNQPPPPAQGNWAQRCFGIEPRAQQAKAKPEPKLKPKPKRESARAQSKPRPKQRPPSHSQPTKQPSPPPPESFGTWLEGGEWDELLKKPESSYVEFKKTLPYLVKGYNWRGKDIKNHPNLLRFLKTVVCMWNSPNRTEDAYIIYGVQEKNNVKTPIGVDPASFDDSILNAAVADRFSITIPFEVLRIRSEAYRGKCSDYYIVIRVPPITKEGFRHLGPAVPKYTMNKINRKSAETMFFMVDQYYCRQGTCNLPADRELETRIRNWFSGYSPQVSSREGDWLIFFEKHLLRLSESRQHFILVASPFQSVEEEYWGLLEIFGMVHWTAVLDFDTETSRPGGLLKCAEGAINAQLSMNVQRTLPTDAGDNNKVGKECNAKRISWVFVRGDSARPDTLAKDHREWLRRFSSSVEQRLKEIAIWQCGITPTTLVVVWDSSDLALLTHLRTVLETSIRCFGEKVRFVFVVNPRLLKSDHEDFQYEFKRIVEHLLETDNTEDQPFQFSPVEICRHLRHHILRPMSNFKRAAIKIPFSGDGPDPYLDELDDKELRFIQEELEIVPSEIYPVVDNEFEDEGKKKEHKEGSMQKTRKRGAKDFYLGKDNISWLELEANDDVVRDVHEGMYLELKRMLERGGIPTSVVVLKHVPGAGGTTVARRLLYTLRAQYPCVICESGNLAAVSLRVARLSEISKRPVLVLIDGHHLPAYDLWSAVVNELKQKAVILNVRRVHHLYPSNHTERRKDTTSDTSSTTATATTSLISSRDKESATIGWELDRKLTLSEAMRFYRRYGSEAQNSEFTEVYGHSLSEFSRRYNGKTTHNLYTPFYFAFYAFKEGFQGLQKFVSGHLHSVSDYAEAREILLFVAFVHHYGCENTTVDGDLFGPIWCGEHNMSLHLCDVFEAIPEVLENLLVDEKGNNSWRTPHVLIAEEVLRQLMSQDYTGENWKHMLKYPAAKFAELCHVCSTSSYFSHELKRLVHNIFLWRETLDNAGERRQNFCRLFTELLPSDAQQLLETLVLYWPNDAMMHGHLARWYLYCTSLPSEERYKKARAAIKEALKLQPSDSQLLHVKGMIYRSEVFRFLKNIKDIDEAKVTAAAIKAAKAFERSRLSDQLNAYPRVAEIGMLIKIMTQIGKKHRNGFREYVIATKGIPQYLRDCPWQAQNLLDMVAKDNEYYQEYMKKLMLINRQTVLVEQILLHEVSSMRTEFFVSSRRDLVRLRLSTYEYSWAKMAKTESKKFRECVRQLEEVLEHAERISDRQKENLDSDYKLWIQAIRFLHKPPSIESVLERVVQWQQATQSLEASYYLFVLNAVLVLQGSDNSRIVQEWLEKCQEKCKSTTRQYWHCKEYFASGTGIASLINVNYLATWDKQRNFFADTSLLKRFYTHDGKTKMQVYKLYSSDRNAGRLIYNKLQIFFKPFQSASASHPGYYFTHPSDLNTCVSVFIGFSYNDVHGYLPERVDETLEYVSPPSFGSDHQEDHDKTDFDSSEDDDDVPFLSVAARSLRNSREKFDEKGKGKVVEKEKEKEKEKEQVGKDKERNTMVGVTKVAHPTSVLDDMQSKPHPQPPPRQPLPNQQPQQPSQAKQPQSKPHSQPQSPTSTTIQQPATTTPTNQLPTQPSPLQHKQQQNPKLSKNQRRNIRRTKAAGNK